MRNYAQLLNDYNCYVLERDLPLAIKGMTLKENDGHIIILNAAYPETIRVIALEHELDHLGNSDFSTDRYKQKERI